MKYEIVQTSNIDEFVMLVNQQIKEGWQPQGGAIVFRSSESCRPTYLQTMIKIEEEE
jgi:hypothetical protein